MEMLVGGYLLSSLPLAELKGMEYSIISDKPEKHL